MSMNSVVTVSNGGFSWTLNSSVNESCEGPFGTV